MLEKKFISPNSPHSYGLTLLWHTALEDDAESTITHDDITSLFRAVAKGDTKAARWYLQSGVHIDTPNDQGATLLYIATWNGHTETVKMLLADHAKVNLADRNGNTPLWVAVHQSYQEIAELLLQYGANIDSANCLGITPLSLAIQDKHHPEIADLLKQYKKDQAKKNTQSSPPSDALLFKKPNTSKRKAEAMLKKSNSLD